MHREFCGASRTHPTRLCPLALNARLVLRATFTKREAPARETVCKRKKPPFGSRLRFALSVLWPY